MSVDPTETVNAWNGSMAESRKWWVHDDGNIGKPDIPYVWTEELQRAEWAARNTSPTSSRWSPTSGHGRLPEGCQGGWEVGKGDPNETPTPQEESDRAW